MWLLGILIALVLICLGVLGGMCLTGKFKKESSTTTPTTTTPTSTEEQAQNGAGWKIFKNFAQSYLIEYPQDATVENASGSEGEKDKAASEAACVKISTKYYHVIILGRLANEETATDCLRTGVGTEWSNAPDETVTAAGPQYTAKGMKTESASLGTYEDFYSFQVSSGERFEYGISINTKDETSMTKTEAKEIVHKIVASFSPAE